MADNNGGGVSADGLLELQSRQIYSNTGLAGGGRVPPGKDEGDRLFLDRGWDRVALVHDGAEDVGREAEVVERQAGLLWPVGPGPCGLIVDLQHGFGLGCPATPVGGACAYPGGA